MNNVIDNQSAPLNSEVKAEDIKSKSEPKEQVELGEFGSGRYSTAARELFADSQRLLGITDEQADKLARSFSSELGRMNMQSEIQISKVNKDSKVTLKEVAKIKGITLTHAICLAKLVNMLQEAKSYGIKKYVEIELEDNLIEWLNK